MLEPLPQHAKNIIVDGVLLHSVAREDVRTRIIAMSQAAVFLPGGSSIKQQLDWDNTATLRECANVLKTVELGFMANLPEELEKPLRPETLSGGQRLLFNLARTILRKKLHSRARQTSGDGNKFGGLLLLDEVTASLDRETEKIMMRVVAQEFKHYTVLMISHRLETTLDFDKVLLMESGRVVEFGNPQNLILDNESRFRRLFTQA